MKKLSVIITNYNTRDTLADCLDNLKNIYPNKEVIVVDNGSSDKSADMIKAKFPDVKLFECENIGLSAAGNVGLKASTGDYLLYIGSDAFPEVGCLEGMVEYMEAHTDVGMATAQLYTRDGALDMDAHRGFPTPFTSLAYFLKLHKVFPNSKTFNHYFLGGHDLNSPHEIDLCISHFMLFRRSVFDAIGEWDTRFFVFGEDVDICYRVKEANFKIMYLPQWRCLHYKGTSIGLRRTSQDVSPASKETKKRMKLARTTARLLFYEKHLKNKYPLPFYFMLKLLNFVEVTLIRLSY